ncbi:MAG: VWA domain-containing protein [Deltaproteobacteria bacterium]|nr:VWA domain-containing protein [Deltaproteobacteria bacterium]
MTTRPALAIGIAAALLGSLAGCTYADLQHVIREVAIERQSLSGEICAPAPTLGYAPYRVLFVIDTSLSNSWNDPEGRREQAVRSAISSLAEEETVSFGIITFSDEPHRRTFGFTRDLVALNGAIQNVGTAQGGTNYSDTLAEVIDFILSDIGTLSADRAARTHYLVYWLSDGYPTVGVTEPAALYPAMTALMEQVAGRVAEIRFNTAYLGAAPDAPDGDPANAEELLQTLAAMGNGGFQSIPAGERIEFEIDRAPIQLFYRLASALVFNRHALMRNGELVADSDGDGIDDVSEQYLGLDPANPDSDGDGYRDGIEYFTPGGYDPRLADPGCSGEAALDRDRDGLRDCEEQLSGTLPLNPDSDGDLVLDGLEVLMGTEPTRDDATSDDDLDLVANLDEVRFHLDPRLPNAPEEVSGWGYRYQLTELPATDTEAPPCYRLQVDNLTMAETAVAQDHPVGGNVIEVVAAFRASDQVVFRRAELRGRVLRDLDLWDPPGGVFELSAQDFGEVAVEPCAACDL